MNLTQVKQDCEDARLAFENFADTNYGPDDFGKLLDNPDVNQLTLAFKELNNYLKKNRKKKILIVYAYAGHGIMENAAECVVTNSWHSKTKFYALFRAERTIRALARSFTNTFHLALWACCREIANPKRHCNGYKGPYLNAKKERQEELKRVEELKQHNEDLTAKNKFLEHQLEQTKGELAKINAFSEAQMKAMTDEETKEESKENQGEGKRGDGDLLPVSDTENYYGVFGCAPSFTVKAATLMMKDIRRLLTHLIDFSNMRVEIPRIFLQLSGRDSQFEFVQSSNMKAITLPVTKNLVAKSHAVIFVNEKIEREGVAPLIFNDADKHVQSAKFFCEEILNSDKIEIIKNSSKAEVLAKFKELNQISDDCQKSLKNRSALAFTLIFIGHKLDHRYPA